MENQIPESWEPPSSHGSLGGSFDTEERLHQFNQVCSRDLPPETSELHDLVNKNQLHKNTHTCYKNSSESPTCRFGFLEKRMR